LSDDLQYFWDWLERYAVKLKSDRQRIKRLIRDIDLIDQEPLTREDITNLKIDLSGINDIDSLLNYLNMKGE
jgi:hypothetical protein